MASTLSILHFNDVYNVEGFEREPVGGAARLASKFKEFEVHKPLIVFSGDCLNPSIMSTVTKGKHMVPVMHEIGVHVAALGNHDLDHGVGNFAKLCRKCSFPWLLANVLDKETDEPIGGVKKNVVLEWQGLTVGFFGLAEFEWISTLSTVDPETLQYIDFVEAAQEQVKELMAQGVDAVIALTHMRLPNDELLARQVDGIDLILGGHDHDSARMVVPPFNTPVIKSGCDFKEYTFVTLQLPPAGPGNTKVKPMCTWESGTITSSIPEDPAVRKIVDECQKVMGSKMEKIIGWTVVDLDGRFSQIRTHETALGNLVCDIWRQTTRTDIALLNSGTLRSDMIHTAGPLKMKDLVAILPMADSTTVLECSGKVVLQALEHGVSQYPKLEGRFPQVSGISFKFNPSKPPGGRIVESSVQVGEEPLQLDKVYSLATKGYLSHGKDGYDCFVGCKQLVSEELGPILPTVLHNHFKTLQVLDAWKVQDDIVTKATTHWSRLAAKRKQKAQNAAQPTNGGAQHTLPATTKTIPTAHVPHTGCVCMWDCAAGRHVVHPIVSGRIVCVAE